MDAGSGGIKALLGELSLPQPESLSSGFVDAAADPDSWDDSLLVKAFERAVESCPGPPDRDSKRFRNDWSELVAHQLHHDGHIDQSKQSNLEATATVNAHSNGDDDLDAGGTRPRADGAYVTAKPSISAPQEQHLQQPPVKHSHQAQEASQQQLPRKRTLVQLDRDELDSMLMSWYNAGASSNRDEGNLKCTHIGFRVLRAYDRRLLRWQSPSRY
jgi:hypothetical protein